MKSGMLTPFSRTALLLEMDGARSFAAGVFCSYVLGGSGSGLTEPREASVRGRNLESAGVYGLVGQDHWKVSLQCHWSVVIAEAEWVLT